ncbi:MAG TPA: rhodanese-like domain-containing protein, partial [Flavobacterium sp.]
LFIGDVGRPDLAQTLETDLTQEILAGHLYDSLRNKIMTLPNDLIIFPSHGAGSACGKNMSSETTDTLGNQKQTNYALRADMTKEEFIAELLNGLSAPPAYFPQNVMLNIKGYQPLDEILQESNRPLSAQQFLELARSQNATILDVRHEDDFVKQHIPGSVFIGIHGGFAPWAGALLMDVAQPILLVTPEGKEEETITRLSRVGFDKVLGFLSGGIESWRAAGYETDFIESVSPEEFAEVASDQEIRIVDARKPGEYTTVHLEKAVNLPLDTILFHIDAFPKNSKTYIHCAGGYRSVIMASLLKARGFHNIVNVEKGMSGIKAVGMNVVSTPALVNN